jgi:hypothetical protein
MRRLSFGKAEHLEIKIALRKLCAEEHITVEIFAADGNPQYGQTRSLQESFDETIFVILEAMHTTRKFRIACDLLHILKRARCRTSEPVAMVVRQSEQYVELN